MTKSTSSFVGFSLLTICVFAGIVNAPQREGHKRTCNPFAVFFVGLGSPYPQSPFVNMNCIVHGDVPYLCINDQHVESELLAPV